MGKTNSHLIIDTQDLNSIIKSLAVFFGVESKVIKEYLEINDYKMLDNADVEDFIDYILEVRNLDSLELSSDFYVTCYHLTKRINKVYEKNPLLNLQNLLTSDNEISAIFKRYNLFFEVNSSDEINCIYNENVIDWDSFENDERDNGAKIAMIKSRLSGYEPDSCVNGVLFSDEIINIGYVEHLTHAPEIVQHIFGVLPFLPNEIEDEFKYLYVVKYKMLFNELIFDQGSKLKGQEKFYHLINNLLVHCSNKMLGIDNVQNTPLVRKDDFSNVDVEDIIYYDLYTEVN